MEAEQCQTPVKHIIRAEGFNTPPLGAVKKVLNPECNSAGERTIPRCLRRGSFIVLA